MCLVRRSSSKPRWEGRTSGVGDFRHGYCAHIIRIVGASPPNISSLNHRRNALGVGLELTGQ